MKLSMKHNCFFFMYVTVYYEKYLQTISAGQCVSDKSILNLTQTGVANNLILK